MNGRLLIAAAAVVPCAVFAPAAASAGDASPDSALLAHAAPLRWEGGEPSGPGFELLLDAARDARFVLIAEEHNLLELNGIAGALFARLHEEAGFDYLVLETGSVIGDWMDAAARDGLDAVTDLVRRYPHAPTFATDEELELITRVRAMSSAAGPAVWGVDQELAALHLLERLADIAPADARPEILRLADEARPFEITRKGDVHYLGERARLGEYEALVPRVRAPEGSEAARLVGELVGTVRVYSGRRDPLGGYESAREREFAMRRRFVERYRSAAETDGAPPRALVKMGHWHILRGIYHGDVPTFGNFLCELAESEGGSAVVIATYVVNSPDAYRNTRGVIAKAADPDGFRVVDLRPLRPAVHAGRIAIEGATRDLVFQADLLLLIGGGRTGGYSVAYGETSIDD